MVTRRAKSVAAGVAVAAVVTAAVILLIVRDSDSDRVASPVSSAATGVPASSALPTSCHEWLDLNVGERYEAIAAWLGDVSVPDTDINEDSVATQISVGCGTNGGDPDPHTPIESAEGLYGSRDLQGAR